MDILSILSHPYAVVLSRWILALVLLLAGIAKLIEHESFVEAVAAYGILPARISRTAAKALPWLEIALGTSLLVGIWARVAAMLATSLFAGFFIAIAINLVRGKKVDCHCFGKLYREKISYITLLRNSVFIVLGVEVLTFADGYIGIDGWLGGTDRTSLPPATDLFPIILTTITAFSVLVLIRRLRVITHGR